jgi:hypothetical protein
MLNEIHPSHQAKYYLTTYHQQHNLQYSHRCQLQILKESLVGLTVEILIRLNKL